MKTELSVEIDRPIAEVFETTNNDVTEWSKTCIEEEILDEKPGRVGTTFRLVTEDRGRKMTFTGTVTHYVEPELWAIVLIGDQFDLDVRYLFEDLGGRTRVTQESEVRGKGFVKALFLMFGWAMKKASCKAQENELGGLKRYCEAKIPA